STGALEEAPESIYLRDVHGLVCIGTERNAEARAAFEAVLESDPSDFIAWYGVGIVESWEGHHAEAIRRLRFVSDRAGGATAFQTMLAGALARAGRRDEAEQIIAGLRAERDAGMPEFGGDLIYYAWAGEVDRAFQALRRAAEERIPGLLTGLWFPWYRPMREDPRWAILEPFLEGE
ncbi:MAG: hypothetical protein GWM92_03110, partial [Gemmatimonadetes bacterium]|nr:hypothetical protein [Gemmatimonadota bacterium]NIU34852.1 hypothetical protein [Gemmatimonadota bacterium]NIX38295.1 hypothetical protein [Gemmatimonadota bacterium]NIY38467.1 hypothetical protein [Gemmatimonadota bacterium]